MYYTFSVSASHMYHRKYLDFLLSHYEGLGMPYSFPVSFNFIASPLLMEDSRCILCLDDDGEAVGALGYIRGTGEGDYEDRHILQLQVAYLVEKCRRTPVFLRGLQFLTEYLEEETEEVAELVFWTKQDAYLARLFGKFAERTSVSGTAAGDLYAYRVTLAQLKAYLGRFASRSIDS
ncbi:hypothetical protein B1748_11760 [Paenibacillus sp. MY03]|jgi:hypothetical protein|uniref:hypothetical protein n=1 Tax=Paenibacillus TaxID=44249 RepID=UPI000B3C33A8|nr:MULTISPECIES: hypothetical protein [Paenibacillus]OUS76354.1 hypothetical protein B1748_11760 [Paenibacillus sp. MY03]